jgi:crotonobetainyl-CoA:carnitine CoA-transferase CaiB-like acyl-CoA transferase
LERALSGIVVVELAGRLAVSVCGALLAELGATVVRIEPPGHREAHPALALPGKRRIVSRDGTALRKLASRATAFIGAPDRLGGIGAPLSAIVCAISAYGCDESPADNEAPDWVLQAECGFMAVTGEAGGPPTGTRVPVFEMYAGINAATAVLAALRVLKRDGVGQAIDISLYDAAFAMLGTHVSAAVAGKPRGHRVGCRHPLCAPWDVYRCGDDAVEICIASEAQWRRLTELMKRPDLVEDERFSSSGSRVANAQALNDTVQDWLASQDSAAVARDLVSAGIPAAKVERMDDVLKSLAARDGIVETDGGRRMRSILRMSRSGGVAPTRIEDPSDDVDALIATLPARTDTPRSQSPRLPLDGIRMVEIGPYTAGPLAGRYLAGLGADIIKVEPVKGEDSRRFQPRFGGVSGFFSNYNWGKNTLALDLDAEGDRDGFLDLLTGADIVQQNLKPGALERLGIDLSVVAQRNTRLIACSISGYGLNGPAQPALDTVIQAQSGVMMLIGEGETPVKSGFSLADLAAAHVAPLAVLAAVYYRDCTGRGQQLDISMLDCLVWLLQPIWDTPTRDASLLVLPASDGHVAAAASDPPQSMPMNLTRAELVARLKERGVTAVPVLELDEVLAHPRAAARQRLSMLPVEGGATTPVLASPYRLSLTPPRLGLPIAPWQKHAGAAGNDSRPAVQGQLQ